MRWRDPRFSLCSATARRGARRCCAMLRRASPVFASKRAVATPHDRVTPLTWRESARSHHAYNPREFRIGCCSARDECAVRTLCTKIARVLSTEALHKSTSAHKTLGLAPHTGAQRATIGGLSHDRSARAVRFREFYCLITTACFIARAGTQRHRRSPPQRLRSGREDRLRAGGRAYAARRPLPT